MTERRKFIHAAFIAVRPKREQFREALHWARDAWDFLAANGEGAAKPHEPRENGADWYAKLSDARRRQFDRFWSAYGYKKGKQGAAMRWHQYQYPDAVVERIVQAATAEARWWKENKPESQTRIFAQGWLEARRWEDYEPAPSAAPGAGDTQNSQRRELLSRLAGLKRLNDARPNPELQRQIDELEAKLRG